MYDCCYNSRMIPIGGVNIDNLSERIKADFNTYRERKTGDYKLVRETVKKFVANIRATRENR